MTSSFLMLVISLISLWEGKDQVPWGPTSPPQAPSSPKSEKAQQQTRHAMHPRVGRARLT